MPSITLHENVVTEVAPTIAIKDPGRGVWVIDLGAAVPLSHICREDVQIPVAIDIAHVQRVAMYHVAAQQITSRLATSRPVCSFEPPGLGRSPLRLDKCNHLISRTAFGKAKISAAKAHDTAAAASA